MKNLALLLTMPIACVYVTGARAAQPLAVSEPASTAQAPSQEADQVASDVESHACRFDS